MLALILTAILVAVAAEAGFEVCYDYACNSRQSLALSDNEWASLGRWLQEPRGTPAEERACIAAAVAEMERIVGARTGTWRDLPGTRRGAGDPGQMDCVDESINTTTYLRLFAERGWLRWHQVQPRAHRFRWIFAEHWSAVIRETGSGTDFVVDSWFHGNGTAPHIFPLAEWNRSGRFPALPAPCPTEEYPGD